VLGNLSGGEILLLLIIGLLAFGAERLPEAARAVGKGLREFRRALNQARDEIERPGEAPTAPPPRPPRPPRRLLD
jgi:sec-independent protein translocase protein TatA